ncbi:unnamed protein product, partial [Discosporangium mesarthrocarpum]
AERGEEGGVETLLIGSVRRGDGEHLQGDLQGARQCRRDVDPIHDGNRNDLAMPLDMQRANPHIEGPLLAQNARSFARALVSRAQMSGELLGGSMGSGICQTPAFSSPPQHIPGGEIARLNDNGAPLTCLNTDPTLGLNTNQKDSGHWVFLVGLAPSQGDKRKKG